MGMFKNFKESLRKGDEKTKQELSSDAGFVETVLVSGKNVGKAMAEQEDARRRESAAKKGVTFDGKNYKLQVKLNSNLEECKKLLKSFGFKFKYGNYDLKQEAPDKLIYERVVKNHGSIDLVFTAIGGSTCAEITCGVAEFIDMLSDTLSKKLG